MEPGPNTSKEALQVAKRLRELSDAVWRDRPCQHQHATDRVTSYFKFAAEWLEDAFNIGDPSEDLESNISKAALYLHTIDLMTREFEAYRGAEPYRDAALEAFEKVFGKVTTRLPKDW